VNERDGFILTPCHTCGTALIVSRKHKEKFSEEDMLKIRRMFPNEKIRWEPRKIFDHAHAHLEW